MVGVQLVHEHRRAASSSRMTRTSLSLVLIVAISMFSLPASAASLTSVRMPKIARRRCRGRAERVLEFELFRRELRRNQKRAIVVRCLAQASASVTVGDDFPLTSAWRRNHYSRSMRRITQRVSRGRQAGRECDGRARSSLLRSLREADRD